MGSRGWRLCCWASWLGYTSGQSRGWPLGCTSTQPSGFDSPSSPSTTVVCATNPLKTKASPNCEQFTSLREEYVLSSSLPNVIFQWKKCTRNLKYQRYDQSFARDFLPLQGVQQVGAQRLVILQDIRISTRKRSWRTEISFLDTEASLAGKDNVFPEQLFLIWMYFISSIQQSA